MFCPNCGAELAPAAKFCPDCGEPAPTPVPQTAAPRAVNNPAAQPAEKRGKTARNTMNNGDWVTPNIVLCPDGKYRWVYEMSLFKNPTIFMLIYKIFFFIFVAIFAVMSLIQLINGDLDGETALENLKIFGYFIIGMTAVVGLSFLIYAAIMGGKYIVVFEMDDKGINHKQLPKQAKKAQKIGILTALVGAASGSFSTTALGLNSTRTEMYTEFGKVRKLKANPKRNVIKLREILSSNQVYAAREDFDFVLDYISSRVPERK